MTYVIEATFTDENGHSEQWLASDLAGGTKPMEFGSVEAAQRMISQYQELSKSWTGKRSFRVLDAKGC